MSFLGSDPSTTLIQNPGLPPLQPPMYPFAQWLSGYLATLVGQPAPSYPGQVDPGLSPTMQNLGALSQQYATSGMPSNFNAASSALNRFINPSFTNPAARMGFGTPQYFPQDPNQFLPGGQTVGSLPYTGGMGGGMSAPPMQMPPMGGGNSIGQFQPPMFNPGGGGGGFTSSGGPAPFNPGTMMNGGGSYGAPPQMNTFMPPLQGGR